MSEKHKEHGQDHGHGKDHKNHKEGQREQKGGHNHDHHHAHTGARNQQGSGESGATASSESKEASLQAALDKAKNDYLYLLAEFDNYRKNAIKERSDLVKYGSEAFVREFLGVLDNFQRALSTESTQENQASFREGVQMIAGELLALLNRFGVEEVKAENQLFDPNKHEALSSEPRDDLPPGHVARVFKKAYKMHDRLIRPAQVTVSVVPPKAN